MKKTKIIVPALGLLLLSTAASVTGTVAWFAANRIVTASGMSVTVKSDSTFLLIQAAPVEGENDAAKVATIQGTKATSATATSASAQLLPVAHDTLQTSDGISVIEGATDGTSNKWYTDFSNDPASATGSGSTTHIASASFANYVLVNEFDMTIAVGGNSMTNLKVDTCTIAPSAGGDQAVKVLVATASGCEEFSGTGGTGSNVLQSSLSSSTLMVAKVYIYWDGADTDVYSNNLANLLSTSVTVTFTGTVA